MNLLFFHGAPATGKLTIAKIILSRIGGELEDNHSAINSLVGSVDIEAPDFWRLVKETRKVRIKALLQSNASLVITTSCYVNPA